MLGRQWYQLSNVCELRWEQVGVVGVGRSGVKGGKGLMIMHDCGDVLVLADPEG